MKHILPLTYEPKIPNVRSGKCTQTIRPRSNKKPKKVGDYVMFHGWEEKPYRSKWGWRTPYWKITKAFYIEINPDCMIWLGNSGHYPPYSTYQIEGREADEIAMKDGFLDYDEMYLQFKKMYDEKLWNKIFTVIQWKFVPYNL